MTESNVKFVTRNIVLIDKNGYLCCITKSDLGYIVVFKPGINYDDTKLISLVHKKEGEDAYVKFMYLVAKMCRKDVESKYFAKNVYSEHLCNGDELSDIDKSFVRGIVSQCIDEIHKVMHNTDTNK